MTATVSPLRILMAIWNTSGLDHLRGERDDLHERPLAQLARHRAEDARPARLLVVVDEHHRVLIEADVGPVLAAALLDGAYHDGLGHVTLLHTGARDGVLDRDHNDVAQTSVAL